METGQIQSLFSSFIKGYDLERENRIWEKQNADFKVFWKNIVMNDAVEMPIIKLKEIIQIFDAQADRGPTRQRVYEEAVARAIIYQNHWENAFAELKRNKRAREALNKSFEATTSDEKINAISDLRKINVPYLTGGKGVMLGCILSGYDAFQYLSMASLEHRYWTIDAFNFGDASTYEKMSYGERVILTNSLIIQKFKELLSWELNARTLSRFLYSNAVKSLWFHAPVVRNVEESSEELINEEVPSGDEIGQNFAFEQHLEDFLIANWEKIDFAAGYELLINDDGQPISKQYRADGGRIDILVRDKKTKDYVVIELKKNRPTDVVVGQVRRYIGWVTEKLAEPEKVKVRGIIIVPMESDDLRYALYGMNDIEAYVYKVNFAVENIKK